MFYIYYLGNPNNNPKKVSFTVRKQILDIEITQGFS